MSDEHSTRIAARRSVWGKPLLILGVWLMAAIATAIVTRIDQWNVQPWQARGALLGAFFVLPVALPLTLVILRGWGIVPWLIAGAVIVEGIAVYLRYTEFARRTAPLPEQIVTALIVAGVGACWLGCWVAAAMSVREERLLAAVSWGAGGFLATLTLGVILMAARAG